MLKLLLVMFALCPLSGVAWAKHCTDVRQFDFRNTIIQIGQHDENELHTLFNEPDKNSFSFRMRDGVAFITEDNGVTQDWRAELLVDRLVHPDSSSWIRVLVLENVHLMGTSTWRYVMAFGCEKGRVVPLFQFSSEGVTLKHLDSQWLRLYQAIWASTDPHTSPSKHRELYYKWNIKEHRYRRAYASAPENGAAWEPDER